MKTRIALFLFALILAVSESAYSTEYFVDSKSGADSNSGVSPQNAWKSLERVNRANLEPGDVVRFRRGGLWRGILRTKSGAEGKPILYSDYAVDDERVLPRIVNSVDLTGGEKWTKIGDNLWSTKETDWTDLGATERAAGFAQGAWHVYTEEDASATCSATTFDELDGAKGYVVDCKATGSKPTYLQLTTQNFPVAADSYVALRFKARASVPFTLESSVSLMMTGKPWSSYGETLEYPGKIDSEWREYNVVFLTTENAQDGRITFFLGTYLPTGCKFEFVPLEAHELGGESLRLRKDVGNLVMTEFADREVAPVVGKNKTFVPTYDKHEFAGFKRWALEELKELNDFWYDETQRRVLMLSDRNPGEKYLSIEAPLRENTCTFGAHDIIIERICFSHTGSHGISLPKTKRCVVRDCEFDWIGGGDLYNQGGKGQRTRYGNGVEFWDGCEDCVVERCRFSRVYDVAITTQGPGLDVARNLVMRDNVMFRCEQAFEIWFTNRETIVEGLVFERNLCVDCGREWSHIQRPNKISTAILGYGLDAKKVDFTIRENVFCDSAQFFIKCWHNRILEYTIDDNVYWVYPDREYYSGDKYFCYDANSGKAPMTYEEFRAATGHDKNSRWIEPKFQDYEHDDFTLVNRDELNAGPRAEN